MGTLECSFLPLTTVPQSLTRHKVIFNLSFPALTPVCADALKAALGAVGTFDETDCFLCSMNTWEQTS